MESLLAMRRSRCLCHCEDAATKQSQSGMGDCFASLAMTGSAHTSAGVVLCILAFGLPSGAAQETKKDGPRQAAVYLSNGEVFTGEISLTPGRTFKLNLPKAGELKTSDMITGEDVQYGKVRTFTFEPVRSMEFYAEREEMSRQWRFTETTKYDEKTGDADYSPAKKEFSGKPYPVRYLAATVDFASGETLQGHLYTTTIYLKTKDKTLRWILRSKEQGKEGQSLDELVYVERIRMLDKPSEVAAQVKVKLTGVKLGAKDAVQALTRESLTPVPTKITGADTCTVTSALGEDFYLALRQGGKYVVGWPAQKDSELFALAQDHLSRIRDFYNERQLLGAIVSKDGQEVLTLVNLRGAWPRRTSGKSAASGTRNAGPWSSPGGSASGVGSTTARTGNWPCRRAARSFG